MLIDWHMYEYFAKQRRLLSKYTDRFAKLKWLYGWEEDETENKPPKYKLFARFRKHLLAGNFFMATLWAHCMKGTLVYRKILGCNLKNITETIARDFFFSCCVMLFIIKVHLKEKIGSLYINMLMY